MLLVRGGKHHVGEFVLILRCHGDDIRQAAQIGDVKNAVVGRAVVAERPARSMQNVTGKSCRQTS